MFIRGFVGHLGETLSATSTKAQKTGLDKNGEYAVSNLDLSEVVYVNSDNSTAVGTADATKSLPVFPQETKIFRCPFGTLDYIGSGNLSVMLNKVKSSGN